MSIDPTLQAALGQDGAWIFGAIRIALPGATLRLLDGAAVATIDGETYAGSDPVFGTLASLDEISAGIGDEAPELKLSLYPADGTAAATLASPAMQGSEVRIMVGAINPATGALIGTPELKFLGEIDVPTLINGQGQRMVEYSIVSVFERLFEVDEGQRATEGFHQSIWPSELGLSFMTGTEDKLWWGGKPPAGAGNFGPGGGGGMSSPGNWQNQYV